jgi:hypothetical protein
VNGRDENVDRRRRCAFCNASDAPLNREHVWPSWIQAVLESRVKVPIKDESTLVSGQRRQRAWDDRPYRLKVRAVCRGCNGGWMSRLEERAKPLLTPLMQGMPRALEPSHQEVIATWGFKTAAMHELRHDEEGRFLPSRHRRILFETGMPPKNGGIWIGAYSGDDWGASYRQHSVHMAFPGREQSGQPNTYIATLQAGRLVLQVWGHMIDDEDIASVDRRLDGFILEALRRIWPRRSRSLAWPPVLTLDDQLLRLASDALREGR